MKSKKFNALIIAAALITIAACQSSSQSNGQGATDTPQAQSSSAPVATGPCINAYLPVVEGATWTSSGSTDVGGPFTRTTTITDVGTDAFLAEWSMDPLSGVVTWTCTPDGLLEDQSNGGVFSSVLSGPDATIKIESVSNTGITVPVSIQAGDTWSQINVLTGSSTEGVSLNGTLTLEFSAVGMESVTVPAGTFDAMKVNVHATAEYTQQGFTSTIVYDGTDWLVEGVGRVQSIGEMSTPMAFTYEAHLDSYSIP
jgi:hypothetical protein